VTEPASRFFVAQRLKLHALDWGNPDAPPLVLVHGGRDHAHSWDRVARALCRDFHVVAPDLRGHGESDWTSDGVYAAPCFIYDLACLVEQIGAPVTLVGHSLGGSIVLRYAGIFPERVARLVVVEGTGQTPPAVREKLRQPAHVLWAQWVGEQRLLAGRTVRRYKSLAAGQERLQAANRRLSDDWAAHLTRHAMRRHEDGTYSWKYDEAMRSFLPIDMPEPDRLALPPRITCKVLLVHGGESWARDPRTDGTLDLFADARVAAFASAGHWVHHDEYEAFMAALTGFLDEGRVA
jgi:pimeloyl-ACP methyl ester carboxylesterase